MLRGILSAGICLLFLLSGCTSDEDRRIEEVLDFAGDNSGELKQVLSHYERQGDGLKLKAARFLIANMEDKYAYDIPDWGAIHDTLRAIKRTGRGENRWKQINYKILPKVYDAQVMTADYLIENIDLAFDAWRQRPWGRHYSFEDFCEYILPYRIGDEPLERWRKEYMERSVFLLDSLYRGTDVIGAADAMQCYANNAGYQYNVDFDLPHYGAPFLRECWMGTCREYADFIIYLFRSAGIPIASDHLKFSPGVNLSHSWVSVQDTTGRFVPIEFETSEARRDWKNLRSKGKVYRSCFSRLEKPIFNGNRYERDVTADYFGENRMLVPVREKREGFIAVHSFSVGWVPIGSYRMEGGCASVENVEPGVILMSVVPDENGKLRENGFAFRWEGDKVSVFKPDMVRRERVRLFRKYPLTNNLLGHLYRMNGLRVEGSDCSDFADAETLAVMRDSSLCLKRYVRMRSGKRYRYVRLLPPAGCVLDFAGLRLYADTAFTAEVDYRRAIASVPVSPKKSLGIESLMDDDNLTFYYTSVKDAPLVLDFGRPVSLGGMLLVPHNDDNYVVKGECYELFYQNGTEGWVSLGRKIAEGDVVEFDFVPSNALLKLHNCTKGREEQVFLWENGMQWFVAHLRW